MRTGLDAAGARLDELERLHDGLNARVTAVLAESTRRALAGEASLLASAQAEAEARDEAFAALAPRFAEGARRVRAAVNRLVALEIARERDAHPTLTALRQWVARGRDGRGALADPRLGDQINADQVVQLGRYWRVGDVEIVPVSAAGTLVGCDLAAWALVPPDEPLPGPAFAVLDGRGDTLVEGAAVLEPDLGAGPLRLRFPAVEGAASLRLTGGGEVESVGLKLFERRRLQPLTRRVRARAWLVRPVHA